MMTWYLSCLVFARAFLLLLCLDSLFSQTEHRVCPPPTQPPTLSDISFLGSSYWEILSVHPSLKTKTQLQLQLQRRSAQHHISGQSTTSTGKRGRSRDDPQEKQKRETQAERASDFATQSVDWSRESLSPAIFSPATPIRFSFRVQVTERKRQYARIPNYR